jgi:hypothetical protein
MAHQAKLIEQGLVALLVAAGTVAGARVYRARIDPLKKGALPAIALRITDEEVDLDRSSQSAPRELTRLAVVEMQLLVRGDDEAEISDAMWDFQEQVENAMDADPFLAGTAADSILIRFARDIGEVDGRSDPLIGSTTLRYSVTYRTTQGQTATDALVTIDVKHKLVGGVADTLIAEDTFTEAQ